MPISYGVTAGAELTILSFTSTYGNWVSIFTAIAMCCFAFSTIIGWGLYGARCIEFLLSSKAVKPFMVVYSLIAILGVTVDLELVWSISDTCNGLMLIPNLLAVFLLSGTVFKLVKEYLKFIQIGGNPMKYTKNLSDLRVVKTKKSICNAFIKLLAQKDFRSITITDIAKMADVNRKTLYNYYSSTDDIMKEIVDKSFSYLFENTLAKVDFKKLFQNPEIIFSRLNSLIEEDIDTYTALFKIEEPGNLLQKVEFMLKEKMLEFFLEKNPENMTNIMIFCEYCSAGVISAYRYWFNSSQKIPLEEFSKKVCCMLEACMESLSIKWEE